MIIRINSLLTDIVSKRANMATKWRFTSTNLGMGGAFRMCGGR